MDQQILEYLSNYYEISWYESSIPALPEDTSPDVFIPIAGNRYLSSASDQHAHYELRFEAQNDLKLTETNPFMRYGGAVFVTQLPGMESVDQMIGSIRFDARKRE